MNRPTHFEILADEPDKIATFYEKTLGWEITPWNGGETPYLLVTTGKDESAGINGGIMQRQFQQAVINTIEVVSLDKMVSRVEAEGGKLIQGPSEVPGEGMHAYCADPEGNLFGLMQTFEQSG